MQRRNLARLVAVALFVTVAGSAAAREVYTAKMVRTKGLSTESVDLDLQLSKRATQEEADALVEILADGGSEGLMEALRKGDYGEARVTGGSLVGLCGRVSFPVRTAAVFSS